MLGHKRLRNPLGLGDLSSWVGLVKCTKHWLWYLENWMNIKIGVWSSLGLSELVSVGRIVFFEFLLIDKLVALLWWVMSRSCFWSFRSRFGCDLIKVSCWSIKSCLGTCQVAYVSSHWYSGGQSGIWNFCIPDMSCVGKFAGNQLHVQRQRIDTMENPKTCRSG